MKIKYNEIAVNFNDILNSILPPIKIEENIELDCDKFALESHGIGFDKEKEDGNYTSINLPAKEYTHDFYKGEKTGFYHIVEENGKTKIHLGIDFSYGNDCPLSCAHPNVYSPITGTIESINEEKGQIVIKDCGIIKIINGIEMNVNYYHLIEHLDKINSYLEKGMEIYAGNSLLGTMGGRSKNGRYWYPQHIHYGILIKGKYFTGSYHWEDREKNIKNNKEDIYNWYYINPQEFWDKGFEIGCMEFDEIPKELEEKDDENKESTTDEG